MLILLSPAKKIAEFVEGEHVTMPYAEYVTAPLFQAYTVDLIKILQCKTAFELAGLMHLSSTLALLNYERFQKFFSASAHHYPALFLFQGDVYKALKAKEWDEETVLYAQLHLRILSGLYGILKPLTLIEPYRLEMGTPLATVSCKNLYQYWSKLVTDELNNILIAMHYPVIINLASVEYSKVIDRKQLNFPVINIHFKQEKNGQLKSIGIYAKKARGAMANYLMKNKIENIEGIKQFTELNYSYYHHLSDEFNLVFVMV